MLTCCSSTTLCQSPDLYASQIAKDILPTLLLEGGSPRALVEAKGLLQISDTSELEALVQKIVDENPKQVCVVVGWVALVASAHPSVCLSG